MDYKVLYRKYRPNSFDKIVGQDYTVTMLKNAIINNKLSHAYLFTGPRGTGKTSTAKVFAKTINCENRINGEACGKCLACQNFLNSSDIIEIDAASNNGVDDIRELINNIKIAPSFSKYKIYIIDEVHMMSQSAFNALLLTLEEPPAHAIFIMATTNVESVPITILSRCQRFNFKKIDFETIKNQLIKICSEENIKIADDALLEIASLSGGLRDALSLLDQLSTKDSEITLDNILKNYGSISTVFIKNLVSSIENNDVNAVINAMDDLENSSSDYKVFIKKLVNELINKAIKIKQNFEKSSFSYEKIKNLIIDLNDCFNKISIHINPYALIKIILLNYVSNSSSVDLEIKDEVKLPLKEEKEQDVVEIFNDVKLNDDFILKIKGVRINNCFTTAKKDILNKYQIILNENISSSDVIQSFLIDAKIVAAGDIFIIFSTTLESTADLINHHLEKIEEELTLFFKNEVKIIALSEKEWLDYKKEYINNLKNGVKYKLIEESDLKKDASVDDSQLEIFAKKMFDSSKIEIV